MLAARESIAEFIKSKVVSDLAGITTPDIKFFLRPNSQPPEVPGVNLYFYDDLNVARTKYNPHYRDLSASLELITLIDPSNPFDADMQLVRMAMAIDNFMAVQTIEKMDYSVVPPVSLQSSIQWRNSYPLDWQAVVDPDERYAQKSTMVQFRYWGSEVNP